MAPAKNLNQPTRTTMNDVVIFIVGAFVGCFCGVVAMSMAVISKKWDDES